MFDIGFSEIVVIFGLALVVLGPDKLPRVAATIGRWVGRARAMARQFTDQLQQEANNLKAEADSFKADVHVDLGAFPTLKDPPPTTPPSPAAAAPVAPATAHPAVDPVAAPVADAAVPVVEPAVTDSGHER